MFESKTRDIIIPQYEHGRLAGVLAQFWGNADFDRPEVPFDAFVRGVALHDWHYGLLDDLSISNASETEWLAMARKGLALHFDDPVTDIITKLHLRRLFGFRSTPEREAAMAEIDDMVTARLEETECTRAQFEYADRITRFCDYVAFYFAFEAPGEHTFQVGRRVDSVEEEPIYVRLSGDGRLVVNPWPFAAGRLEGIIVGYQAGGYPERLEPLVVPYEIRGD